MSAGRYGRPVSLWPVVGSRWFKGSIGPLQVAPYRSVLAYAAMALAVVLIGIPMYWMLLATFKTNQEIFTAPPTWIPLAPTLENLPAAWNQAPFGHFYLNSLIYTLGQGSIKLLQAVFC